MPAVDSLSHEYEGMIAVDVDAAVAGFLVIAKRGFDKFPWVGDYEGCRNEYTLPELEELEPRLMSFLEFIGVTGQAKTYVSVLSQRAHIRALVALNVMRRSLSRNSAEATYDYHVALHDKRLTAVYTDFGLAKVNGTMSEYARLLALEHSRERAVVDSKTLEPVAVVEPAVQELEEQAPSTGSSTSVVVPACAQDAVVPGKFAVLESVASVSTVAGEVVGADVELMQLSYDMHGVDYGGSKHDGAWKARHAVTLVEAVNSVLVSRVWGTVAGHEQSYDGPFVNMYVGSHGVLRYLVRVKHHTEHDAEHKCVDRDGLVMMTGKSAFDAKVRYLAGDFWENHVSVPDGRLWASVVQRVVGNDHAIGSSWHKLKSIVDGRVFPTPTDFPSYVALVGEEVGLASDRGGRYRHVLTQIWRAYARAVGALVDAGEVLLVSDTRPCLAVKAQVHGQKARGGFSMQSDAIGYCYLALVLKQYREEVAAQLGPWPTFQELMVVKSTWFDWPMIVTGARVVRVRDYVCHIDDRVVGYHQDGVHLLDLFAPAQLRQISPPLRSDSLGHSLIRRVAVDDAYARQPYYSDQFALTQRVGGWFGGRGKIARYESDFSEYDAGAPVARDRVDLEIGRQERSLPFSRDAVGAVLLDQQGLDDAMFEKCLQDLANGSQVLLAMLVFQSQWLPRSWFFHQREVDEACRSTFTQRVTDFYRKVVNQRNASRLSGEAQYAELP